MEPGRNRVAFLRGINVGGAGRTTMKDLRETLEGLGLERVRTYLQSGNVVFDGGDAAVERLEDRIASAVLARHGFRPRVMILEADALRHAVAHSPFPDAEEEPKSLHLFFLGGDPADADLAALEALATGTESFVLEGRVFYLHAPDGIGRSKAARAAERLLGVPATARNWRTVVKVLEVAEKG